MKWRLAKKILKLDGRSTCRCWNKWSNGHKLNCKNGQSKHYNLWQQISRKHQERWWRIIKFDYTSDDLI